MIDDTWFHGGFREIFSVFSYACPPFNSHARHMENGSEQRAEKSSEGA